MNFLQHYPGYRLLGIGYKTIPYSGLFGREVVSDNDYLGRLVEASVLALSAVLWSNASLLRNACRPSNPSMAFFGSGICYWAGETAQMLSGDLLAHWRVLPLYFWTLAIAVRASHENPDRGSV